MLGGQGRPHGLDAPLKGSHWSPVPDDTMYLLGIHPNKALDRATLAVVKNVLTRTRKDYHVEDIVEAPAQAAEVSLRRFLVGCYHDRRYITAKRVFSQDKRPAKNVVAHPRLVFDCTHTGTAPVHSLRENRVPVVAVSLVTKGPWSRVTPEKGWGIDCVVPCSTVLQALSKAVEEGRMVLETQTPVLAEALDHLRGLRLEGDGDALPDLDGLWGPQVRRTVLAVALPVWFRETIAYTSAYIASSRLRNTQI